MCIGCFLCVVCHPYLWSLLTSILVSSFFFNAPAPTEIYTLSLHDALPISRGGGVRATTGRLRSAAGGRATLRPALTPDRKSTRLNSSHRCISYAVFCLKKKKKHKTTSHARSQHKPHHTN